MKEKQGGGIQALWLMDWRNRDKDRLNSAAPMSNNMAKADHTTSRPAPRYRIACARLTVKSRLVMNALLEQFRFFCVPVFQGLNR